jgi:hypothetical protein
MASAAAARGTPLAPGAAAAAAAAAEGFATGRAVQVVHRLTLD